MQNITSVVMSCAGMGTRLGMGIPKSLINISGRPLIHWQLDMLKDIEDIRIVVGYKATDVIAAVRKIRDDVVFVMNNQYSATQTGYSLGLGAMHGRKYTISLDGDLLVHPEDWKKFLDHPTEVLGTCPVSTEQPVCALLDKNDLVVGFTRNRTEYEWSGLLKIETEKIPLRNSYVYELLQEQLPFNKMDIRCCEIDTPLDYDKAEEWVKKYPLR